MDELKNNKVVERDGRVLVCLNLPEDFVYDVDNVLIECDSSMKKIKIINGSIPEFVKKNMEMFFKDDLVKYVKFLEENLEIFFRGDTPTLQDCFLECSSEVGLRPYELPRGYEFPVNKRVLQNVSFEAERKSISVVICDKMNIQIECNRCKAICAISESTACKSCKTFLEVRYIPDFDFSSLGFLNLQGCKFICFNPVPYQFICDGCGNKYKTKNMCAGSVFRLKCYECSADLFLKIVEVKYIHQKRDVVKAGLPLPNSGTCKHYKKSYRWFRFPCCKSLYPCDVCHDEKSGHVHEIANKMVCGLCSKEQEIRKECDCGMSMKKRTTTFWEGGRGNRNKATMNKKDRKKYTK